MSASNSTDIIWNDEEQREAEEGRSLYEPHSPGGRHRAKSAPDSYLRPKKDSHKYYTLASLVGHQSGLDIFRRFACLNAKGLLYMEAEIADLENQLHILERKDQASDDY